MKLFLTTRNYLGQRTKVRMKVSHLKSNLKIKTLEMFQMMLQQWSMIQVRCKLKKNNRFRTVMPCMLHLVHFRKTAAKTQVNTILA